MSKYDALDKKYGFGTASKSTPSAYGKYDKLDQKYGLVSPEELKRREDEKKAAELATAVSMGPLELTAWEKAKEAASAFGDFAVGGVSKTVGGLAQALGEDPTAPARAVLPWWAEAALPDEKQPIPEVTQFGQQFADTPRFQEGERTLEQANVGKDSVLASAARAGGSVAPLLAGVATGVATKNPWTAASVMGASSYGSAYDESRNEMGLSTDEAQTRSAIQAGVETLAERVGLKYVLPKGASKAAKGWFDKMIDTNAATKVAGAVGVNAAEEVATTAAQMATDEAMGYKDYKAEDYAQAAQDSAVAGGLLGGAVRTATLPADTKKPETVIPKTGVSSFDAGAEAAAAIQASVSGDKGATDAQALAVEQAPVVPRKPRFRATADGRLELVPDAPRIGEPTTTPSEPAQSPAATSTATVTDATPVVEPTSDFNPDGTPRTRTYEEILATRPALQAELARSRAIREAAAAQAEAFLNERRGGAPAPVDAPQRRAGDAPVSIQETPQSGVPTPVVPQESIRTNTDTVPVSATATPSTTNVDIGARIRVENERSIRETGQSLTPERVASIVAEAPQQSTTSTDSVLDNSEVEGVVPPRITPVDSRTNDSIRTRLKEDVGIRSAINAELSKPDPSQRSVRNVLNSVVSADSTNPYTRALASRLSDIADSLGVGIVGPEVDPVDGSATRVPKENNMGAYSPIDNSIRIVNADPETVIHEVVHGLTKGILNDPEIQLKNPTVKAAVDDLKGMHSRVTFALNSTPKLLDSYPTLKKQLISHGIKNIDEFTTMALTNPELQSVLASIPDPTAPKKTLWQSLKDILKRMLGLGRIEGSVLDRALDRGFEVIDFAGANPAASKEATARVGRKIQGRVLDERVQEGRMDRARRLKAEGKVKEALLVAAGRESEITDATDEMAVNTREEQKRPIPKNRGKAVGTVKRVLSAQAGRMFNKDFEKSSGEILAGKDAGQRVYASFLKAGYPALSEADKARVNRAVDGAEKITDLPEPIQKAVKDYRNRVMMEQLRLANETGNEETKQMIYDSIARGDYSTRAYAAFDMKPDAIDTLLHFLHQAKGGDKPYWLWKQERTSPELVRGLESYIRSNLVIPDIGSLDDKAKGRLAQFYDLKGDEATIDEALQTERARLGGNEETQVKNLMRELADPLDRNNQDARVEKKAALDLTILKNRKSVPKPIREFWGEFTEAPLKGAMTVSRIMKLTAQTKMLNNLAVDGRGRYLFAKGEDTAEGFTTQLPSSPALGPLAGMYTRPDIAEQLETLVKAGSTEAMEDWQTTTDAAWRVWSKVIGFTKVTSTVLNAPTGVANMISAASMLPNFWFRSAAMGMPITGAKGTFDAFLNAVKDIVPGHSQINEDVARKLISAGVLREGVQLGELNEMLQTFEQEAQIKKGSKGSRALRRAGQIASAPFKFAVNVYQAPDNMIRLQATAIEFAIQKKLNPSLTDEQAMDIAADRAKNQVPTWSRASPVVRRLGTALGSFPTFTAEVFRTTAWQFAYGVKDLKTGLKTGNKKLAQYGATQIVGTTMQLNMMKLAFPALIATMFGFDDDDREEKRQALTKLVPEFHEGNAVELMHVDPKTMKAVYTNSDRIDFQGPLNTAWARIKESDGFEDGLDELWQIAIDTAGTGPGVQAWSDAITGRDEFGRALSSSERREAVGEAYIPKTEAWLKRVAAMERRGVDPKVIAAARTGLPIYEVDTPNELKYAALGFNDKIRDATAILKRAMGEREFGVFGGEKVLTQDDYKQAYAEFLANEHKAFKDLSDHVQAAKTIYGSESEATIREIIKQAAVPKDYRRALLSGEFNSKALKGDFLEGKLDDAIRKDPKAKREIEADFSKRMAALRAFRKDFKQILKDEIGETN